MSTPALPETDRRARGLLVLLVGLGLLLVLGFLCGYLVLRAETSGAAQAPDVVRPTASPAPGPVVVDGAGQALTQPTTVSTAGTGQAVSSGGTRLVVRSRVEGRVGPGAPATLVLTVTNPDGADVVLTAASARITSVSSAAACSLDWYAVGSFTGNRALGPGASTTVELPITFADSATVNQDSCKGAQYAYSYQVRARQA